MAYSLQLASVVSVDFESEVVLRMQARAEQQKATGNKLTVSYLEMDFLEMSFDNASFDAVVDKGSLDALCCDESDATQDKVQRYFRELRRVSKPGATYLVVSLAQDFVLAALLREFGAASILVDRISARTYSKLAPLLITVDLAKATHPKSLLETGDSQNEELAQLTSMARGLQLEEAMASRLNEWQPGEVFELESRPSGASDVASSHPRYQLVVMDQPESAIATTRTMGAFVVPLGCERELEIFSRESQERIRE